jgi:hypothetical protein
MDTGASISIGVIRNNPARPAPPERGRFPQDDRPLPNIAQLLVDGELVRGGGVVTDHVWNVEEILGLLAY